jgi:prepilin-type N-terminal cleavage/methylation domain-containing protein
MTRLRDARGFTLIEVLLAASLMLVVLAAALTTLERSVVVNKENQLLTDDTESARNAIDLLSRDIRDATAYQTTANTTAASVVRAAAQDFAFKTVDPNAAATTGNAYRVRTVRYCYAASAKRLVRQVKPDVNTPPAECPAAGGWATTTQVPYMVNATRPMFEYDSATPDLITRATVRLYVDSTPNKAPVETPLVSGVFLRNANRAPVASFTANAAPKLHVQLNGSASLDPDGGVLTYTWKDGAIVIPQTGPVVDYIATSSGPHTITLTVTDPGGLTHTTTQPVTVVP